MLTPQIHEAIERLVTRHSWRTDAEVVTVYAAGSLVVGLGNPTSDVDLVVVHRGAPRLNAHVDECTGVLYDVRYWREEDLMQTWREITRPLTFDDYEPANHWRDQLTQLGRLHLGLSVVNDAGLAELVQRLSRPSLEAAQAAHFAVRAATYLRDAIGAFAKGDLLTAWDTSLTAVRLVVQMALASAGDIYVADKFTWVRLRRCDVLKPIYEEVDQLLVPAVPVPLTDAVMQRVVDDRLRFATGLSALAALYGPRGGLDRATVSAFYDSWSNVGTGRAGPAALRPAAAIAVPLSESCFITGEAGLEVPPHLALVWLLCQNHADEYSLRRSYEDIAGHALDDRAFEEAFSVFEASRLLARAGDDGDAMG